MSAPQKARAAGFKDLNAVSDIVNKHRNTLSRWDDENPQLFDAVLMGAFVLQNTTGEPDEIARIVRIIKAAV